MKNFEEELMDAEEYRKYLVYALNSLDKRIKCNAKDAYYDDMADFSYKRAIIAKEIYQLDRNGDDTDDGTQREKILSTLPENFVRD